MGRIRAKAIRRSWRRAAVTLGAVALLGGAVVQCADAQPPTPAPTPNPPPSTTSPPAPAAPTAPPERTIGARVSPVSAEELGPSWRPGCPVEPAQLRRVELDHVGMDGQLHRGELIVHVDLAREVIEIFEQLRDMRYPIEKMRTVEHYPNAEDELSMQDNNTSAFNCRGIPGSESWSWHAYGRAVDLNPLLNPYVDRRGAIEPRTAGAFLDRTRDDPGLLRDGDPAVLAFTDRNWRWGGHWRSPIDYQHFELQP